MKRGEVTRTDTRKRIDSVFRRVERGRTGSWTYARKEGGDVRAREKDEPSCLRKARRKEVSPRRVGFFLGVVEKKSANN